MTERAGRWGLRALAVAGALTVWFFSSVEKRERISEKVVDASVTYNLTKLPTRNAMHLLELV